jgi:hypothetical protein
MDDQRASLANEAEAIRLQLGTAAVGSPASVRVAAARARFLPYVIVGGIPFAMLTALIAANITASGNETRGPMVVGLTAGIVFGMAVGWVSLQLLERLVWRRSPRRFPLDAAIVAATVPGYAVGGWVAAIGVVFAAATEDDWASGLVVPNIWPVMLVSAAVIYPLSYTFARRDLDRPTSLMGAISAALDEPNENPAGYSMVARFCLWVAAAFGALVGLFVVLAAIQAVTGRGLASAAYPTLVVIAFFVAWTGSAVWFYALAIGLVRRLRG